VKSALDNNLSRPYTVHPTPRTTMQHAISLLIEAIEQSDMDDEAAEAAIELLKVLDQVPLPENADVAIIELENAIDRGDEDGDDDGLDN
jgi:hypothetical protein